MNLGPRVLARELIGLKTFGYRPQFFPHSFHSRAPIRTGPERELCEVS
jgi:hypothetical protein